MDDRGNYDWHEVIGFVSDQIDDVDAVNARLSPEARAALALAAISEEMSDNIPIRIVRQWASAIGLRLALVDEKDKIYYCLSDYESGDRQP